LSKLKGAPHFLLSALAHRRFYSDLVCSICTQSVALLPPRQYRKT
jgi:hypothetical protein